MGKTLVTEINHINKKASKDQIGMANYDMSEEFRFEPEIQHYLTILC